MKLIIGLFGAVVLAGVAGSAYAQAPPPGSYQQSCREIRMQGTTLTAVCRRAKGRGEQPTALNVTHCAGDIGNNNGQLQCSGGQPAAPAATAATSGAGLSWAGVRSRARLSRAGIWPAAALQRRADHPIGSGAGSCVHEEHEIRDRLAYTPYGEERERLQYRPRQGPSRARAVPEMRRDVRRSRRSGTAQFR